MAVYNVLIALGSNMGNRKEFLNKAIYEIGRFEETSIISSSHIYETEPVGYLEQENFLNMVVHIRSKLEPLELLDRFQNIEQNLNRKREVHWGPRTIDIDILLVDDMEINTPRLTVPHPRMMNRGFVLIPFKDIKTFPVELNLDALIGKCEDRDGVKRYDKEG